MNMFLGEDVFQKSVADYLKKHKYNNAAQDDLWDALTRTAHAQGVLQPNVTVKMIMDTWTVQTGYPLVTVTRDYESNAVTVTQVRIELQSTCFRCTFAANKNWQHWFQERYLSANEGKNKNNRQAGPCWWIPLSYTSSKEMQFADAKPERWLTCDGPVTFNPDVNQNQWLLFNLKAAGEDNGFGWWKQWICVASSITRAFVSGLFRVNYDEQNWMLLQNSLMSEQEYSKIDPLNRVQIIADSLALAWNGKFEYTMAFNLISYLQHETEYLPWKTALSSLSHISHMLMRTPTYGYFKVRVPPFSPFQRLCTLETSGWARPGGI